MAEAKAKVAEAPNPLELTMIVLGALALAALMCYIFIGAATDVRFDETSGRCVKNCLGISDPWMEDR